MIKVSQYKQMDIVELLLSKNADPNIKDKNGYSSLTYCIFYFIFTVFI